MLTFVSRLNRPSIALRNSSQERRCDKDVVSGSADELSRLKANSILSGPDFGLACSISEVDASS